MSARDENGSTTPARAAARRLKFPERLRLIHARQFQAVFLAGLRKTRGPLTVHARPNGLTHARLGLSIGARVGNAVVRNRLKRRLRDAFRLLQHDLPGGYDLVVAARPHEPLTLAQYQDHLRQAIEEVHRAWTKQQAKSPPKADPPPAPPAR